MSDSAASFGRKFKSFFFIWDWGTRMTVAVPPPTSGPTPSEVVDMTDAVLWLASIVWTAGRPVVTATGSESTPRPYWFLPSSRTQKAVTIPFVVFTDRVSVINPAVSPWNLHMQLRTIDVFAARESHTYLGVTLSRYWTLGLWRQRTRLETKRLNAAQYTSLGLS